MPHLLLNHRHRHASHQSPNHMAVPEDMWRDLPPGELLPGRNLLDPGLLSQTINRPEYSFGAQVAVTPAGEEPLLARLQALLDGLQSGLAYPGGPKMSGLRPAALDANEPVMEVDI